MPSILESVSALLSQGEAAETLSRFIGTDRARLDDATRVAAPSVIGAMADRAGAPDGDALFALLDNDDGSVVDNLGRFLDRGDTGPGAGMLDVILGRDGDGPLDRLGGLGQANAASMSRLLPMLAPIVVGVVARLRSDGQLDNAATARLLAGEKADLEHRGLLGAATIPAAGAATVAAGAVATGAAAGAGAVATGTAAGAGAVRAASGGVRLAAATGAGAAATSVAAAQGRRRGAGWLWWALGGTALVALAAIGLAQCGGDDTGTSAGGGQATTVNGSATDGDGNTTDGNTTDGNTTDGNTTHEAGTATTATPTAAAPTTAAPTTAAPTTAAPTTAAPTTAGTPEPEQGSTINELLDLDPVTFEVNSARITPDGEIVLDRAIEFLAANPDVSVEIGGHTDADGGEASNMALSQARAESVKTYLEDGGIDGGRMTPVGYGESKPQVANDTPENKAINRRIEFTIL